MPALPTSVDMREVSVSYVSAALSSGYSLVIYDKSSSYFSFPVARSITPQSEKLIIIEISASANPNDNKCCF